jgi:hypothetical protein
LALVDGRRLELLHPDDGVHGMRGLPLVTKPIPAG